MDFGWMVDQRLAGTCAVAGLSPTVVASVAHVYLGPFLADSPRRAFFCAAIFHQAERAPLSTQPATLR